MKAIAPKELARRIRKHQRILVTTHPSPDGDALGSLSAAAEYLESIGCEVVRYNPDPAPHNFEFLGGCDRLTRELPEQGFDATVVLDCSDERMFPQGKPSADYLGTVYVLDHHKTVGNIADFILRDVTAASAGAMVYRWLCAADASISRSMADALWCTLITDTGGFRYQNTNGEAMRMGADLLELGVDPWGVASQIYESRPRGQLDLLSRVLQTLQLSTDGRTASLAVTDEMLRDTGCSVDMVDGFINYARGLRGVEVAAMLKPTRGVGLRVSLRSRGLVDVSEIASSYGGGGHRNAAGFTVQKQPSALLPELHERVASCCNAAEDPS